MITCSKEKTMQQISNWLAQWLRPTAPEPALVPVRCNYRDDYYGDRVCGRLAAQEHSPRLYSPAGRAAEAARTRG